MVPAQAFSCKYLWYFPLEICLSYLRASLCIVNDLSLVEVPSLWLLWNQDRNATTGLGSEGNPGKTGIFKWKVTVIKNDACLTVISCDNCREGKGQNPLGFPPSPASPQNKLCCFFSSACPATAHLSWPWFWETGRKDLPLSLCSSPAPGSGKCAKLHSKKQHIPWASLPASPWNSAPRTTEEQQE